MVFSHTDLTCQINSISHGCIPSSCQFQGPGLLSVLSVTGLSLSVFGPNTSGDSLELLTGELQQERPFSLFAFTLPIRMLM